MSKDYHKLIRLYVADDLSVGDVLPIEDKQLHYLRNVMRKNIGDSLRIFNGRDGEFLVEIIELKKNKGSFEVKEQKLEQPDASSDIWAVASVIKRADIQVEKACELGATRFVPVKTDKTVVHKIKAEKLQAIAIEASEQCERLEVMSVDSSIADLEELVKNNSDRKFILCLERSNPTSILYVADEFSDEKLAVVVGPEGGFSEEEVSKLECYDNVCFASLGKNILRAETALITALSAVQLILDKD